MQPVMFIVLSYGVFGRFQWWFFFYVFNC